jgi:YesN/AraC family two-component response regulator
VISVIIADDQTLVREGLEMLVDIEPDIEVVGQASDEAVELARRLRPDLVAMDIRMPIRRASQVAHAYLPDSRVDLATRTISAQFSMASHA